VPAGTPFVIEEMTVDEQGVRMRARDRHVRVRRRSAVRSRRGAALGAPDVRDVKTGVDGKVEFGRRPPAREGDREVIPDFPERLLAVPRERLAAFLAGSRGARAGAALRGRDQAAVPLPSGWRSGSRSLASSMGFDRNITAAQRDQAESPV
jgi:hypothetical protein